MNKEAKQHLALSVLFLLLLVKFVVLPEFESQAVLISEISNTQKAIARYESLSAIRESFSDYEKEVVALETRTFENIPKNLSSSEFMLVTQQEIEKVLQKNKLKLNRLNWFNEDEIVFEGLVKRRASINFSGLTKDTLIFHQDLLANKNYIKVVSLSIDFNNSTEKTMGTSNTTFVVDAFYQGIE